MHDSTMQSSLVQFLVIFSLSAVLVNAKIYSLPLQWTTSNSADVLPVYQGSEGRYRVLRTGAGKNDEMMSENKTFCLAFYEFNNSPGNFYFSIVFGCNNVSHVGVPIWIANRDKPAMNNATLLIGKIFSKFVLINPNSNSIWESATPLAYTDLTESGNWIMYSNNSQRIWQSFDFPSDVLLPGQTLRSMLVSRSNLSTEQEESYTAVVETNRLVFYLNITGKEAQPYYVKSYSSNQCKQPSIVYKSNIVELGFGGSSTCKPVKLLEIPSSNSSYDSMQFVRLEPDGNLVVHKLNKHSMVWDVSKMFEDPCQLPMACGPYGLCQNKGECKCLVENNVTVEANVSMTVSSAKCRAPNSGMAPCTENTERNNHFTPTGNYFSNPYSSGLMGYSFDSCLEMCLSNCSCSAFFFSEKGCFLLDDILGGFINDTTTQGFIKFRNDVLLTGRIGTGSSNKDRKTKAILGILITVAVGLAIMLLVMLKVFACKTEKKVENQELYSCLSGLDGLPPRFTYQELEVATDDFSKKLGTGGFGSVYGGVLPNGKKIAVKKLEGTTQGVRQFVAEVASMANINHVNILRLCGFCIENHDQMLVYDFMQNSSLDQWLFGNEENGKMLNWGLRKEIAIGTARGLAYLHEECRDAIIHLDVKPQNILLDEKMVPKVADFGMAKQVDRDASQVVTCVRGTPGYLAPEWLMHSVATKKCDVYSFGMVLLEMIGGRKNVDVLQTNTELGWYFPAWAVNEVREGRTMDIIDPKIRASVPELEGSRFIHVALWCIQENASSRPSMEEVVQMLEGVKSVQRPPLQFHFAVPTQTIVNFTASEASFGMSFINTESVSMAYVNPPSFGISSLIR